MFAPLTFVQVDAPRRMQTTGHDDALLKGGVHGRVY